MFHFKKRENQHSTIWLITIVSLVILFTQTNVKAHHRDINMCSEEKVSEITADASTENSTVLINCSVSLSENVTVTKQLLFEGDQSNNVDFNCNGAKIKGGKDNPFSSEWTNKANIMVTHKKQDDGSWIRPEHIRIRNCDVWGGIVVDGPNLPKERSYERDYVEVLRNHAPKDITFDTIKLIANTGEIPLYLYPGTNNVRFINSEISGRSDSVAIYFDAETTENVFKNNHVDVKSTGEDCFGPFCWDDHREVMAIDGSNNNTISNNYFSGLSDGGIYLYRNCGEKGTTRQTTPSGNTIVNNIFYYDKYTGGKPAIYIGSRNGKTRKGNDGYCDKDDISEYGSGVSDYDHAQDNIIMQNQIFKRKTKDMIKVNNEEINSPNYIGYNTTISSETVDETRKAGCFVKNGEERNFVNHLDKVTTYELSNTTDFKKRNLTCRDGVLYPPRITGSYEAGSYKVRKKSFNCYIEGNNDGNECNVYCDGNQEVIGGVHAACNLENSNSIVENELDSIPINRIAVLKQSGNFTEGTCYVGTNELRNGNTLSGNYRDITAIHGKRSVNIGCQEHDRNGGDCQIRGNLYCIKYVPPVFHQ